MKEEVWNYKEGQLLEVKKDLATENNTTFSLLKKGN